jgi:MYXO-CTERM domain-containing protein
MSQRSFFPGLAVGAGLLALTGCSGAPEEFDPETLGETEEAIKGGYDDAKDTSVVGIILIEGGLMGNISLCSGTLIAPNVVLTAQHCVAPVIAANPDLGVQCTKDKFGPTFSADKFHVSTKQELTGNLAEYHDVRQVITVDGPSVCGSDQAIIILAEAMNPAEAVPLAPRVDIPLVAGEKYYAVGYGATEDDEMGTGAGARRRRDNLVTTCVASGCMQSSDRPQVFSTEWEGQEGICGGDSGGPAFDLSNRVIGVTSRGGKDCTSPVYGYVFGQAQFIKDSTLFAAGLAGIQAPAWATGGSTDPVLAAQQEQMLKSSPPLPINRGCSVSRSDEADPGNPVLWFTGGALFALAMIRRRSGRARSGLQHG